MFDHLRLQKWPFTVVPDPASCNFIAGREQLRDDLEKLLRNFCRHNTSSIHPIWSWLGSGKTHALHYLSNRAVEICKQNTNHIKTVYSEFPRNPRSFVDVYRGFALPLEQEMLSASYLEICTSSRLSDLERNLRSVSSDLVSALKVLVLGEPDDQDLAMRWLRAESLQATECRKLGISKKIGTSEDSSRVLTGLVRMFSLLASSQGQNASRLVWLLDELQRIGKLPPRIRDEINAGLHSTFNACPTSFSMILSFSGHPTEALPAWFSPELKDRIGRTKVMVLPPMETEGALRFIKDVLAHFRRPEDVEVDPYFPFTESACRVIIENIRKHDDELKPRAIMQVFNAVLLEADEQIESGKIAAVSPKFANAVLAELAPLE